MWEGLADAGGGVGVRPGEDVRQPLPEVDAVLPAGGREAGEDGHRDAAAPAPHEEPVPPPQAERADDALAGVAVDVQARVGQMPAQLRLAVQRVGRGPGHRRRRQLPLRHRAAVGEALVRQGDSPPAVAPPRLREGAPRAVGPRLRLRPGGCLDGVEAPDGRDGPVDELRVAAARLDELAAAVRPAAGHVRGQAAVADAPVPDDGPVTVPEYGPGGAHGPVTREVEGGHGRAEARPADPDPAGDGPALLLGGEHPHAGLVRVQDGAGEDERHHVAVQRAERLRHPGEVAAHGRAPVAHAHPGERRALAVEGKVELQPGGDDVDDDRQVIPAPVGVRRDAGGDARGGGGDAPRPGAVRADVPGAPDKLHHILPPVDGPLALRVADEPQPLAPLGRQLNDDGLPGEIRGELAPARGGLAAVPAAPADGPILRGLILFML